ncbi:MAG: hypothetical protein VKJ85_11750, partial [Prochlorothrix sp.]|nr:hypothetical protein [Prochlorothrix sp.]
EETLKNRLQVCENIKQIIGLDYCKDKKIPDFEQLQDGKHIREGKPDSWKKHYNNKELSMLSEFHGSMMKVLNYSV